MLQSTLKRLQHRGLDTRFDGQELFGVQRTGRRPQAGARTPGKNDRYKHMKA
jgi:hypothetical protein